METKTNLEKQSQSKYELKFKETETADVNTRYVESKKVVDLNVWRISRTPMGVSKYNFECSGGISNGVGSM